MCRDEPGRQARIGLERHVQVGAAIEFPEQLIEWPRTQTMDASGEEPQPNVRDCAALAPEVCVVYLHDVTLMSAAGRPPETRQSPSELIRRAFCIRVTGVAAPYGTGIQPVNSMIVANSESPL
jgi:hypothetical protein